MTLLTLAYSLLTAHCVTALLTDIIKQQNVALTVVILYQMSSSIISNTVLNANQTIGLVVYATAL